MNKEMTMKNFFTFQNNTKLKLFTIFVTSFSSLIWFSKEHYAKEKEKKELKRSRFGFITHFNEDWIIESKSDRGTESIKLHKENKTPTDNEIQILCSKVEDAEFNFESYTEIVTSIMIEMIGSDSSKKIKNFQSETKKNSFGNQYQKIDFLVEDLKKGIVYRREMSIFFHIDTSIVFEVSNEEKYFGENCVFDLIDGLNFINQKRRIN